MPHSIDSIGFSMVSNPPLPVGREKVLPTTKEVQEIHAIYMAIVESELHHGFPLHHIVEAQLGQSPAEKQGAPVEAPAEQWLELLDLAVTPHMVRSYLNERGASDASLRGLIR